MDLNKNGKLIRDLRKARGMTQKEVAESLGVLPKTVSKWETGHGFPDVSAVSCLSEILGVDEKTLLSGSLAQNPEEVGNMKKTKFYVCPKCGGFLWGSGESTVSCCGHVLKPLEAKAEEEGHKASVVDTENDFYVTFSHEMTKVHYISFAAYVCFDRVLVVRLYPEQDSAVRFPKMYGGKLYFYCNTHGLFVHAEQKEKNEKRCIDKNRMLQIIDEIKEEKSSITISGGEPTLHPDIAEIIKYAQNVGVYVTLLSNGENFANKVFFKMFAREVDARKLRVITTLHSHIADEHEKINRVSGSLQRSIHGLKELHNIGTKIEIKHCITKDNVKGLLQFYQYYDRIFPEDVNIQLCGIDYMGVNKENLYEEFLAVEDIKDNLERLFDHYIENRKNGSTRKLYAINIPLCSCDPYYWKFMSLKKGQLYKGYFDPYNSEIVNAYKNVDISKEYCKKCKVSLK